MLRLSSLSLLLALFSAPILMQADLQRHLVPRAAAQQQPAVTSASALVKRAGKKEPIPDLKCTPPAHEHWRVVMDPLPKDLCLEPNQAFNITWGVLEGSADETPISDVFSAEMFSHNTTAGLWTYVPAVKLTAEGNAQAFCATDKWVTATMPSREDFFYSDLAPEYKNRWGFELQVWSNDPDPQALAVVPVAQDLEALGFWFADDCKSLVQQLKQD